ncbi:MAG: RIP metalloprotease RseP [Holosporales bacterium]|nr:RIP metalloprotease RseP [Holosporales bacterium]
MAIGSFIPFIILLCVVVIVHELGHLIAARANKVFCEIFSIGFGPTLLERTDKSGTKWRLSLLPLGGYVKMFGDADASSVKETIPEGYTEEDMDRMSAHRKKPWQRLIISAGGPFANFIFAILILFSLSVINGTPEYGNAITVAGENSLAYASGLRDGDAILKANGYKIDNFGTFRKQIVDSYGKELKLEVKRGEQIYRVNINMFENKDGEIVPIKMLGVAPKEFHYRKLGVFESLASSVATVYNMTAENICSMLKIATGKMSAKNVGGVISIFKMSSDSAQNGFISFIVMIAVISTVLGAINLLPIPVLDGGTVVICAIEWIIGRPLNKKFVEVIFTAGLIFVAGLMALGVWNDLSNCKFFVWLENLFK